MRIKPEIRIFAIDDGPLVSGKVGLVGLVFRGADWLGDVVLSEIKRDGFDVTEKILGLAQSTNRYEQIRAIMLDGVTYAGFNVVDIRTLHRRTGLPILVVMQAPPNFQRIKEALTNLERSEERWNLIQSAGDIHEIATPYGSIFVQYRGIDLSNATELVRLTSIRSRIPEPLRVAHLIASKVLSKV